MSTAVLMQQDSESEDSCASNSGSDTPDIRRNSSRPALSSFNYSVSKPSFRSINVQSFSKCYPSASPPDFKENSDYQPALRTPPFPLEEGSGGKPEVKQFATPTQRLLSQQTTGRQWQRLIQFEDVGPLEEICREKRPRRHCGPGVVRAVYKLNKRKVVVRERDPQPGEERAVVGILREAAAVKHESQSGNRRKSVHELKPLPASKLPPVSFLLHTPRSDNGTDVLGSAKTYTIRSPQDMKTAQLAGKTPLKKSRAENNWVWKGSKGLAGKQ